MLTANSTGSPSRGPTPPPCRSRRVARRVLCGYACELHRPRAVAPRDRRVVRGGGSRCSSGPAPSRALATGHAIWFERVCGPCGALSDETHTTTCRARPRTFQRRRPAPASSMRVSDRDAASSMRLSQRWTATRSACRRPDASRGVTRAPAGTDRSLERSLRWPSGGRYRVRWSNARPRGEVRPRDRPAEGLSDPVASRPCTEQLRDIELEDHVGTRARDRLRSVRSFERGWGNAAVPHASSYRRRRHSWLT